MNSVEEMKCAICQSPLGDTLFTHVKPDRFEIALGIGESGYRREWRECPRCRTATNVHAEENLRKLREMGTEYYEADFSGKSISEKYQFVMAMAEGESDNAGRVLRILQFLNDPKRGSGVAGEKALQALDIGAGTGVFLSKLREVLLRDEREGEFIAIEPDPMAAAHLRELGTMEVIEGLFRNGMDEGPFDLITLNKVLEHIEDPVGFLREIAVEVERGDSILYVEVPDVMTIGRRKDDDNILGALHWHLYSPHGLISAIENAGLVPLQIQRFAEPSSKLSLCIFACSKEGYERLSSQ